MKNPTSVKPSAIIFSIVLLCLLSNNLLPGVVQVEGFLSVDSSTTRSHAALGNARRVASSLALMAPDCHQEEDGNHNKSHDSPSFTRRNILAALVAAPFTGDVFHPPTTRADVDVSTIEMKEFKDPYGMFSIDVPQSFFTIRRAAKGDLPDIKTGKGRRGSSIFTAGDLAKAEVIAIERYVVSTLRFCMIIAFFRFLHNTANAKLFQHFQSFNVCAHLSFSL
jgi:hypothetical protein